MTKNKKSSKSKLKNWLELASDIIRTFIDIGVVAFVGCILMALTVHLKSELSGLPTIFLVGYLLGIIGIMWKTATIKWTVL